METDIQIIASEAFFHISDTHYHIFFIWIDNTTKCHILRIYFQIYLLGIHKLSILQLGFNPTLLSAKYNSVMGAKLSG